MVLAIGCPFEQAAAMAEQLQAAMQGVYLTCSEPGGPTQELRPRLGFGVSGLNLAADSAEELLARACQDAIRRGDSSSCPAEPAG